MGRAVTLRRLHRWIGLALALPLFVQGLTGCFLAVAPLLGALAAPRIARDATRPDDIGAIVALAAAQAPGLAVQRYRTPPDSAVLVDFAPPQQRQATRAVSVDPVRLVVLAVTDDPDAVTHWVHSLHETLLVPQFNGRSVIGWTGIGLVGLALSGAILWWPRPGRWRAALTVSRRARGFLLYRQLHGAGGFIVAVFLLAQGLSGVTLGFPQTSRLVLGLPPGPPGPPARSGHDGALDVAQLAARAMQAMPGAPLVELRMPMGPRSAMAIFGTGSVVPTTVMLGPDGRVLSVQDPQAAPLGLRLLAVLRAIHSGTVLAPAWPVVLCVEGLVLSALPVTGLAMWLLRRRRRHRRAVPVAAAEGTGIA